MVYLSREKGEDSARLSWKCGSRRLGSGIAAGWRIWKELFWVVACRNPAAGTRPSNTSLRHWRSQAHRLTTSKSVLDHGEGTILGKWLGDLDNIAIATIRPCWHWGHCRSEQPVRSS